MKRIAFAAIIVGALALPAAGQDQWQPQPNPPFMQPGYQAPRRPTLMDFNREYMRDLDAKTREAQRWNQADEALGAERARRLNCLLGRGHVDNCGG